MCCKSQEEPLWHPCRKRLSPHLSRVSGQAVIASLCPQKCSEPSMKCTQKCTLNEANSSYLFMWENVRGDTTGMGITLPWEAPVSRASVAFCSLPLCCVPNWRPIIAVGAAWVPHLTSPPALPTPRCAPAWKNTREYEGDAALVPTTGPFPRHRQPFSVGIWGGGVRCSC